MKQQEMSRPREEACVMCGMLCVPYGRTFWGGFLCCRKCNSAFYRLPLEEQRKRGAR